MAKTNYVGYLVVGGVLVAGFFLWQKFRASGDQGISGAGSAGALGEAGPGGQPQIQNVPMTVTDSSLWSDFVSSQMKYNQEVADQFSKMSAQAGAQAGMNQIPYASENSKSGTVQPYETILGMGVTTVNGKYVSQNEYARVQKQEFQKIVAGLLVPKRDAALDAVAQDFFKKSTNDAIAAKYVSLAPRVFFSNAPVNRQVQQVQNAAVRTNADVLKSVRTTQTKSVSTVSKSSPTKKEPWTGPKVGVKYQRYLSLKR